MMDITHLSPEFGQTLSKAENYVKRYFAQQKADPATGTIGINSERYILVRAASASVDFFETLCEMYQENGEEKAVQLTRSILYDISRTLGRMDARHFHQIMKLDDPMEKLLCGPIYFAHCGWAYVNILDQSRIEATEDCYIIYEHPFSFEADAWLKSGKNPDWPVCTMNAGYSAGWTEESIGFPVSSIEITCVAKGDPACRFIMGHPAKLKRYLEDYFHNPQKTQDALRYYASNFFEAQKRSCDELSTKVLDVTKELDDFAYVISHDLKAPVRRIEVLTGFITEDLADKIDDEQREQLELLSQQAMNLNQLIEGVLQYSRIGRMREAVTTINLNSLVHDLLEMIEIPDHIAVIVDNELPTIDFERPRMQQVFEHLIDNAIRFMDKDQGEVHIEGGEKGADFWEIRVRDNGPGIEQKQQEKIFGMFQTLAPKDDSEHIGVGLTLVKKIVEFYGGGVQVESEPGRGTTFILTIPKRIEKKNPSQKAPTASATA